MIKLNKVSKTLDHQLILEDITAEFEKGKIHGIIGRNGCGKSMLFRLICGLIEPDTGTVEIDGKPQKEALQEADTIGALIEKPKFLENLSGLENLMLLASIHHKVEKEEIATWMDRFGLETEKNKKYGKYSLGMKQKLGIIQALMEHQSIIILDEPFNGLDQNSVEIVRKILLQKKEEGTTVLLASHIKEDILLLCDRVYEMDAGKIVKTYHHQKKKETV